MNPLVSIIIPFYNAEKFLAEAIQSVLEQTYNNWELLLIDDGSTDSSTGIAKEYAQKNERIHYVEHLSHQNKGMGASRNAGISRANGQYIALLDSDDVWLPGKLQKQLSIFDQVPDAAMVYGPALYWFSWTNQPGDRKLDLLQDLRIESEKLYPPPSLVLLIDPLGKGSSVCPSNIVIRKEALNRIGGFEEEFTGIYQAYEDQAFCMKVFLKESVFVSGDCWIKYRKHADSLSSAVEFSGKKREAHLFLLHWVEEFLEKNPANGLDARSAMRRALWPYEHPVLHGIQELTLAPVRFAKWSALKVLGPKLYHGLRRKITNLLVAC